MIEINELLKNLGISKVKLAKYLGVSRQMVYNYLEFSSLDDWPKDKKIKLLTLLDIKSEHEIPNIDINTDYLIKIEKIMEELEVESSKIDISAFDFKDLDNNQNHLLTEIVDLLKDTLVDSKNNEQTIKGIKYLYHFLQLYEDSKEIKYALAYYAKANGFVNPKEFIFNEEEQMVFEGIMFQATSLFNNGGASKNKIIEAHKRFVTEIEMKQEDKLSRTQELNSAKVQALKELGYTEINESNAGEVFEKIAEIQSRKTN